ncbi:MAG: sporulation initiation factor Spo0A C-terminal domain-containing protein [Lachnospiraceae bacterium]|nr:sporulation initiation factor Spo0A C-terminal domain-containing protein [Lachnospiraceae bacterium]
MEETGWTRRDCFRQEEAEGRNVFRIYVRELLLHLGITPNYIGYFYLIDALEMAVEEPQRLLLVTKLIYPEVARHHDVSAQAVERCLRTVAETAWRTNPELLQRIAGHPLCGRLNVSSLLAVLACELAAGV